MKVKFKPADTCFYIFWFFLQVGKSLGYTSRHEEFTTLLLLGIPFAIARMILIKWDRESLLRCVLLNLLGIATALVSKTTTYLLSLFCITAVKDMDLKKIIKMALFVRGPIYIIRTTMAILGFADMEVSYRYANGAISVTRYALGYGHPNTTQFELFMLIMLLFYLYRERIRIWHYVVLLVYTYFMFDYTNSKTAFYLGVLFLCAAFVCLQRGKNIVRQIAAIISKKSWIVGATFTVIGCMLYLYVPSFRGLGTFSSRFLTATNIIRTRSLSLLGNPSISTDLGYVYVLYDGGIILAGLFFVGVNKLLKMHPIKSDIVLSLAFACFSIFNIMEAYTYSVLSNAMLLFLAYVIYPKMRKKDNAEIDRMHRQNLIVRNIENVKTT